MNFNEQFAAAKPVMEEPMPLVRETPLPPPYPLTALGPLQPAAEAICDMTQAPPTIAAQAVLGVASLAAQGLADADRLVSIQHITSLLNQHYEHAMKLQVVEMMWQLVYADGDKDHYEEHLIRQVAELLYLSHGEFIQARHKAEESRRDDA